MTELIVGFLLGLLAGSIASYLALGYVVGRAAGPIAAAVSAFGDQIAANEAKHAPSASVSHELGELELDDAEEVLRAALQRQTIGEVRLESALRGIDRAVAPSPAYGHPDASREALFVPEAVSRTFRPGCGVCAKIRNRISAVKKWASSVPGVAADRGRRPAGRRPF